MNWKINVLKGRSSSYIICYETLACDSGALCLDWREICDGIQHCMYGYDENNCDILEMNICEENEYRSMNGRCIPDEYFLDGHVDCLDWTDEMTHRLQPRCGHQIANTLCDDYRVYRINGLVEMENA